MNDYNMNTIVNIVNDNNKFPSSIDYEANVEYYNKVRFIMHVATCIIISIGLPLTLMAIYALYRLIRKDHVGPIYVINLLISDLIQLCSLMVWEIKGRRSKDIAYYFYHCGLLTSVCFMVCISLERYLLIAHPLWYRFKRTKKISVVVCVVVWIIPPAFILILFSSVFSFFFHVVFLLIPLPLFIFFLVGTLRALSVSVSVSSEEKRRIVGILILVLLIYTLLFLPSTIDKMDVGDETLYDISLMFLKLSPLADLILYFFMRKQPLGKLCTTANCCRVANTNSSILSGIKEDNMVTVSSVEEEIMRRKQTNTCLPSL